MSKHWWDRLQAWLWRRFLAEQIRKGWLAQRDWETNVWEILRVEEGSECAG